MSIKKLMLEDLKRSGLTEKDAKKFGYKPLKNSQTHKLIGKNLASYQIPYFDINGKKSNFYRIRFLEREKGFLKNTKLRYSQPPDMSPKFYYSKLINWKKVRNDVSQEIIFTEGEKKAEVLCKNGFNCIGLGGVWNWKSRATIDGLTENYHNITWEDRSVFIIFDSDIETNIHIQHACNAFCNQLLSDGAVVATQHIPALDSNKLGVDDYILEYGIEAFDEIEIEDYFLSKILHKINAEYTYCHTPNCFIRISDKQIFKLSEFKTLIAPYKYQYENSEGKLITKPAFDYWIEWEHRNECAGVAYEPGEGIITKRNEFNLYNKPDLIPTKYKKNDLKLFHTLVDYIFEDQGEAAKKWFLQWVAYPLQNPGTKLSTFILVHGMTQGTGKSLLGYTIKNLYGVNGGVVDHDMMSNIFNQWAVNKQFIIADELVAEGENSYNIKRAYAKIKNIVTRLVIELNRKGISQYEINDYINYFFTSNHANAMYMEDGDRRGYIVKTPTYKMSQSFFNIYDKWYRKKSNMGKLLQYFLDVDTSDFSPSAAAPITTSKQDMINVSKSDALIWLEQMLQDPDTMLSFSNILAPGDFWTLADLRKIMLQQDIARITSATLTILFVELQQPVLKIIGIRGALVCVRNRKKWRGKSDSQIREHYNNTRGVKNDSRLKQLIKKGK